MPSDFSPTWVCRNLFEEYMRETAIQRIREGEPKEKAEAELPALFEEDIRYMVDQSLRKDGLDSECVHIAGKIDQIDFEELAQDCVRETYGDEMIFENNWRRDKRPQNPPRMG